MTNYFPIQGRAPVPGCLPVRGPMDLTVSICIEFSDKATDGAQASEDWSSLMEICDLINGTEDGCVYNTIFGPTMLSLF